MQLPNDFDFRMLRHRRRVNGFPKQTDVARFVGRNVSTIQRLEQRGILPECSATEWVKLQTVYGLTVEQFAQLEQKSLRGIDDFNSAISVAEQPIDYTP